MKKLIAILAVMIAFTGAIFAVSGEVLQINATVVPVAPVFSIYGGKTTDAITTQGGTAAAPGVISFAQTEANLAADDITVYISIYQSNKAKYNGTANLTITATPLINQTVQSGTYKTAEPTADHISKEESAAGITYSTTPSASKVGENTVVTYAPKYDGRAIQAGTIGSFDLTWGHNDNLSAGSYQATITIEYTAL